MGISEFVNALNKNIDVCPDLFKNFAGHSDKVFSRLLVLANELKGLNTKSAEATSENEVKNMLDLFNNGIHDREMLVDMKEMAMLGATLYVIGIQYVAANFAFSNVPDIQSKAKAHPHTASSAEFKKWATEGDSSTKAFYRDAVLPHFLGRSASFGRSRTEGSLRERLSAQNTSGSMASEDMNIFSTSSAGHASSVFAADSPSRSRESLFQTDGSDSERPPKDSGDSEQIRQLRDMVLALMQQMKKNTQKRKVGEVGESSESSDDEVNMSYVFR